MKSTKIIAIALLCAHVVTLRAMSDGGENEITSMERRSDDSPRVWVRLPENPDEPRCFLLNEVQLLQPYQPGRVYDLSEVRMRPRRDLGEGTNRHDTATRAQVLRDLLSRFFSLKKIGSK